MSDETYRTPRGFVVRRQDGSKRFAVYRRGVLIEGGFFARGSAVGAAEAHDRDFAATGAVVIWEAAVVDHLTGIYNAIGYDAFGDETPDDDTFVDVMRDQFANFLDADFSILDAADVERFRALPTDDQRELILRAGL